jgi:chemotaxis regulatin CheY-phosphate phosphatase CheZ
LAGLNVVSAKAVKHRKRWDNLLDSLIDKHVRKTVNDEHEEDFIDVLLSVQQEYSLTRDNIKAILMVCTYAALQLEFHFYRQLVFMQLKFNFFLKN